MKKNILKWMNTLGKTGCFCLCMLMLGGLAACSDDDDNGGGNGGNGGQGGTNQELVSPNVPSMGWSGSTENGAATYMSADMAGDDEMVGYYAYAFKDGKCTDAVFNIVCENEMMAQYLSRMLNSGEWAEEEDEGDYTYSMMTANIPATPVIQRAIQHAKANRRAATKAVDVSMLNISCTQSGRVVFFSLQTVVGLDGKTVKYVNQAWDTGLNLNELPEKPVFGTWNEATGQYASNHIFALPGAKVEVKAGFNKENKLNQYTETWTLPNVAWAELMEGSIKDQAEDWASIGGAQVEVVRNHYSVTIRLINAELTGIDKAQLLRLIIAVDILNAQPIGTAIF